MQYENLILSEEEGILLVTINREKALNALNKKIIQELATLFEEDAPKRPIKGVILTGAGDKAFVAGADIKELLDLDIQTAKQLSRRGKDIFSRIEQFPKPVIAAVNGYALGGGCELAMACHMRLASESAYFGLPEVKLGIIPGYGGTQRIVQYVGKSKALELMMTGDMINAEEAFRLGLVNHILPAEELLEKARSIIHKIARQGPLAIAKVIESVNAYYKEGQDGFEKESEAFGNSAETKDFKEGARAFIEKRKPNFKGE